MTRDKEIDNAKNAFYKRILEDGYYYDPRDCFEEGAEWADAHPKSPWISVEDDMPCNHKELIDFDISTAIVFVKTKYSVGTDYMSLYCDFTWKWERYRGITHWMPIPEPPKL